MTAHGQQRPLPRELNFLLSNLNQSLSPRGLGSEQGVFYPEQDYAFPVFSKNGLNRSRGIGNTIVELFSEATSVKVCKKRS